MDDQKFLRASFYVSASAIKPWQGGRLSPCDVTWCSCLYGNDTAQTQEVKTKQPCQPVQRIFFSLLPAFKMKLTSSRFLRYEWFGVPSPFDSTCSLVTSPIFSPWILGALRLLFAVYSLVTIIIVLVFDSVRDHDSSSFLSYFTDLSYIGLVAYFWASGVQTTLYAFRGQKAYPLQSWPRILQLLHILLYTTITIFPIIVTVVFWALLASPSTLSTPYFAWSNVSLHIMNSGFAVFEIFFTNAGPSPWSHILPGLVLYASYLGVAYITYATQGFYTYDFLDPSTQHGFLAVYIIGNVIGYCIIFMGVRSICMMRCYLVSRYCCRGSVCCGRGRGRGRSPLLSASLISAPLTASSPSSPPEVLREWQKVDRGGDVELFRAKESIKSEV